MFEYLNINIVSELKANNFINNIKKFRKTNDFSLITEIEFNSFSLLLKCFLCYFLLVLYTLVVTGGIIMGIILLVFYSTILPTVVNAVIALIVGLLSTFGVLYGIYRNKKIKKEEQYDNSIYMLIQYLIELKRGNYNNKIYKDDLSYMFMNIPSKILFILRDIQLNLKEIKLQQKENQKNFIEVVDRELLFLINYIREYYNVTTASFIGEKEQTQILEEIIVNSSECKKINAEEIASQTKIIKNKKQSNK